MIDGMTENSHQHLNIFLEFHMQTMIFTMHCANLELNVFIIMSPALGTLAININLFYH